MTTNMAFTRAEFEDALGEVLQESPVATSRDVADAVGCSRERARQFLVACYENEALQRETVGGGAKVYYPAYAGGVAPAQTEDGHKIAPTQTTRQEDVASAQTPEDEEVASAQTKRDERIEFFPSRREIVTSHPTESTRSVLSQAAHLVDSTESGYLYKVASEDIWNAPYDDFDTLRDSLQDVIGSAWTTSFESRIKDDWDRAHTYRLVTRDDDGSPFTVLEASDEDAFTTAKRKLEYNDHYTEFLSDTEFRVKNGAEAAMKEALYDESYPVIDDRRLDKGESLDITLTDDLSLRDYQQDWVDQFAERNAGVFVGPPGSGKTVAAIGAMERVGGETLILVQSVNLANQWEAELIEKTNLSSRQVGQYHGEEKRVRPVTIATYQTASMTRHRELFNERAWGLVVADECHHAVSKTWKRFHGIQSTARLGLTATPVRESGSAKEIYTLIGPPLGTDWGRLFADDWVEKPDVDIVMVPWESDRTRRRYDRAEGTQQLIEAAKNPKKHEVITSLLADHDDEQAIVFVDWLEQGEALSDVLGVPFISGETPNSTREQTFEDFRNGEIETLLISRVGDEGIDLPNAEVAILASTMGKSRSQTGQRAGRTMRPVGGATAYILLTKNSGEADWGRQSTQYLSEKGISVTKQEWEA